MKDPAFLLYSKDMYEGTRMMLPEERACYLDLLIYQHQNGLIPLDLRRVLMYCSGIDEATLKATLEAKFKQTDEGWYNERLEKVVSERAQYTAKQSVNGTIGQFWKKCKLFLSKKDYDLLRTQLQPHNNNAIFEFIENKEISKATLKGLLKALLKHLVIVNEDVNVIKEINKIEVKDEIEIPFKSEKFIDQWKGWKVYKSKEHGFYYKSIQSEQAALTQLKNLADENETTAISIIGTSIANGWKGFFKEKNTGTIKKESPFTVNKLEKYS